MDDAMRPGEAAADCIRAVGVDGRPAQGATAAVAQPCDRRAAGRYPVAPVGHRSLSRRSGVACQGGHQLSGWKFLFLLETLLHVGASLPFSAGGTDWPA